MSATDAGLAELVEKIKFAFAGKTVTGVDQVAQEEAGGLRLTLLDAEVSYTVGSGDRETTKSATQTVAVYDSAQHRFPGFTLQPSNALLDMAMRLTGFKDLDIDFASHPAFSTAYILSGVYPANTRRLFDHAPLLDELGRRPGLNMGSRLSGLVLYRWERKLEAAGRKAFAVEAAAVFARFEEAARAAALKPALKQDARAFVESVTGEMGQRLRKSLVSRADLVAFVGQPPPRKVPANIRASGSDSGSTVLLAIGGVVTVVASAFALFNAYPSLAAGRPLTGEQLLYAGGAAVFAALGIALVAYAIRAALRAQGLLRLGVLASGRIDVIEPTGTIIDGIEQYRLQLRYQAGGQEVRAECRIMGVAVMRAKLLKAEGKPAPILRHPGDPQQVMYAESLLTLDPEIEP